MNYATGLCLSCELLKPKLCKALAYETLQQRLRYSLRLFCANTILLTYLAMHKESALCTLAADFHLMRNLNTKQ